MVGLDFDTVKAKWMRLRDGLPTEGEAVMYAINVIGFEQGDGAYRYTSGCGRFAANIRHLEPKVGCNLEQVMSDLSVYENEWNQWKSQYVPAVVAA